MNIELEANVDLDEDQINQLQDFFKANSEENKFTEKWKYKFFQEFEDEVTAYVYKTTYDLLNELAQGFLGASKHEFYKSIEIPVVENEIILKAMSFSKYVDKIRPYFRKLKGIFRKNKSGKHFKYDGKVVYDRNSNSPISKEDFQDMEKFVTKFLGDRLNGADEELSVKSAILGLYLRRLEKDGIPEEEIKNMSYGDVEEKYGKLPETTEQLQKEFPEKNIVTEVEFAKQHAGEWLAIKDGLIRDRIVSAVRKQTTQAIRDGISADELAQRLFYANSTDELSPELYNENIDSINRDWKRVAITEMSYVMNNSYLINVLNESEAGKPVYVYFDGYWSVDDKPGSKTDCNKWLGTIARLFDEQRGSGKLKGDAYAKYAVWPNKRNTDGNITPSIPVHPHCKHWWKYIDPENDEIMVVDTKGNELDKKDLNRQRNIDSEGNVYVIKQPKL